MALESWAPKQGIAQPGRWDSLCPGIRGSSWTLPSPAFTLLALSSSKKFARSSLGLGPLSLVSSSSCKSLLDAAAFWKAILGHVPLSSPSPTKDNRRATLEHAVCPSLWLPRPSVSLEDAPVPVSVSCVCVYVCVLSFV